MFSTDYKFSPWKCRSWKLIYSETISSPSKQERDNDKTKILVTILPEEKSAIQNERKGAELLEEKLFVTEMKAD